MTKGLEGLLAHRGVVVFRGEAALETGASSEASVSGDDPSLDSPAVTLGDGTFADADERPVTVTVTPVAGHDAVETGKSAARMTPVAEAVAAGDMEGAGSDGQGAVRLLDDGTVRLTARDVVVATGSRPRPLDGIGFAGALIDSSQALSLDTMPQSAVIIGSGAVALEFASMWNAAGCDVTMLIRRERVLSHADRRAAMALTRELKRRGVHVVPGVHVTAVDTGVNLGATVHYADADGHAGQVYGEIALVAVGREPNTDEPWFAGRGDDGRSGGAGIALDASGFVVTDPFGRTSLPHVWAVGDITAGPQLAHHAFEQGIVVAEEIAGLAPKPVDERTVPTVIFSNPEFASVGMTLAGARADERYANVDETAMPVMANARMLIAGSNGSCSVVCGELAANPGVRMVLGVHIVAPDASDLIAEAQQIVANRVPLSDAARNIHPHPTFSELLGEALLKADGRPLNTR
ncbi:dihydrolipoamide dehydrogenase [Bifidobacterium sp. BRDM6]|uniref:Dihydrolipoamide dehydrogenase n=2 Tax=Bifidobacterium choloepi TaxID=2614131 RepID=A0A6I5NIM3_9BIFI|nr:dihydrolipoamide dehydrogenase [Bifidobacterium choloepi]